MKEIILNVEMINQLGEIAPAWVEAVEQGVEIKVIMTLPQGSRPNISARAVCPWWNPWCK